MVRPQAESNRPAQFCGLLPQPLGHAVTARTQDEPKVRLLLRTQDDSNVRLLLRRKPCCPLHYEPRALPAGLEPALPPSESGVLSTGPWKHRARGRNRTFNAEATGLRPAEHTACSTRAWGE